MHRMAEYNAQPCTEWQSIMLQTIHDGFQHEQPDYWLNFGNPWEIERLNIAYTIKFYGHVSVHDEGGRQTFRWNPGESVSSPRLAHCFATSCVTHWSGLVQLVSFYTVVHACRAQLVPMNKNDLELFICNWLYHGCPMH